MKQFACYAEYELSHIPDWFKIIKKTVDKFHGTSSILGQNGEKSADIWCHNVH